MGSCDGSAGVTRPSPGIQEERSPLTVTRVKVWVWVYLWRVGEGSGIWRLVEEEPGAKRRRNPKRADGQGGIPAREALLMHGTGSSALNMWKDQREAGCGWWLALALRGGAQEDP